MLFEAQGSDKYGQDAVRLSVSLLDRKTREGFEYQLGVNYLGHVELTTLLIEGVMLHAVSVPLSSPTFSYSWP